MATVAAMLVSAGTVRALSSLPSSSSLTSSRLPSLSTRRIAKIRCMAEPESMPDSASSAAPSATTPASSVTPIVAEPAVSPKPKVSTKFTDIFAFSGPAPETINGRLAMFGFVGALAVELATGSSFTNQLQNGGLGLGLSTAGLFTVASLIPMFQGVTPETMVGLIALAITEYVNGTPLV